MSTTESTTATVATVPGVGTVNPSELVAALAAIMPHASTDAFLPILNGVKVETDGDRLVFVASDRYTLGTYSIAWDGGAVDAFLSLADAKSLHAFTKGAGRAVRDVPCLSLTFADGNVTARDYDRTVTYRLGEASTFVKWRAIMPGADYGTDGPGITHTGINPAYLARFAKAADRYTPMVLTFGPTPVKPIRVTIGDAFVGLIMPVRLPDPTV